MSKAVTGKIERSGQKGQYTEAELRAFVQSSRTVKTKQQRDAVTDAACRKIEIQAAMNRGVRFPTVSERRVNLRKLEQKAAVTDSKMARISKH